MSSQIYENTSAEQTEVPTPKPRKIPKIRSEETQKFPQSLEEQIKRSIVHKNIGTHSPDISPVELTAVFTNPAVETETIQNKSPIPERYEYRSSSLDSSRNSGLKPAANGIVKPQKYPDKFHHFMMFVLQIFTVRFLDIFIQQSFPKTKKCFIQIPKYIIQLIHLTLFVVLTIEGVRVIWIENTKVYLGDPYSGLEYGSVDMTGIILFLAYSIMSFCSLSFLYFNSDILSQTGVKFRATSLKPFKKFASDCFVTILYIGLFVLLAITIIWKIWFTFVFYQTFQNFDYRISISLTVTVVVYYLAMWHLSPFILCFTIRSICKQLQHEIEEEIENTKQVLIGKINSDKNIHIIFYDHLDRVYRIAGKFRYIIALMILIILTVSISIFLSAFDETNGILTATRDNNLNDKINKFDFLWLILTSYYFLFVILLKTQSISKLNSLLNRFSELVIESKEVREHLRQLAIENPNSLTEIRENLNLISASKIRFTAAFFGDFTSGLFYALMLPAMAFMVPFLFKLKYLFSHFEQVFFPQ